MKGKSSDIDKLSLKAGVITKAGIITTENEYELLKLRFFILNHRMEFIKDPQRLYAPISCGSGLRSVHQKYIYSRLYFDFKKIGVFWKSKKVNKYMNLVNNSCMLMRDLKDDMAAINIGFSKYTKSMGPGKMPIKAISRDCIKKVQKIKEQDDQILKDWEEDIRRGIPIHVFYNAAEVIANIRKQSNEFANISVKFPLIEPGSELCESIRHINPLNYYNTFTHNSLIKVGIDPLKVEFVSETEDSIKGLWSLFNIFKSPKDPNKNELMPFINSAYDNEKTGKIMTDLMQSIYRLQARTNILGDRNESIIFRYKRLLQEKESIEYISEDLKNSIKMLIDKINSLQGEIQKLTSSKKKYEDINPDDYIEKEIIKKKLEEIQKLRKIQDDKEKELVENNEMNKVLSREISQFQKNIDVNADGTRQTYNELLKDLAPGEKKKMAKKDIEDFEAGIDNQRRVKEERQLQKITTRKEEDKQDKNPPMMTPRKNVPRTPFSPAPRPPTTKPPSIFKSPEKKKPVVAGTPSRLRAPRRR